MADTNQEAKVGQGLGIDTGLLRAAGRVMSSDKWTPVLERALLDAQAGDANARDFLHKVAVACY
jgi:hypothetical protein